MIVRTSGGLGPRLFVAHALVVLTGVSTLVVVLFLVAPGLFHRHLDRAVGTVPDDLLGHVDRAFESAVLISLAAAVIGSLVVAMAVSWFVTRRLTWPVRRLADAAERVADGHYDVWVPASGLGTEFDRLDAAFNTMSDRLATTEQRRRALLADLAHELRTPVATLDGFLEGLEDGVIDADARTWRTLREQTGRLRRLVDDVKQVSSAEERALALAPHGLDLVALAAEAVGQSEARFEQKGVALRFDAPGRSAPVVGDPDRLREVVDNLLDNALRHTLVGGEVRVGVRLDGERTVLEVADDGEGIAHADLPHVFDRFYRADAARVHDTARSGLGLAIARALVHAHEGTIAVESDGPGEGTLVRVSLPSPSRAFRLHRSAHPAW